MNSWPALLLLWWTVQSLPGGSGSPTAPQPNGRISRWFEIQPATLSLRYRFLDNGRSLATISQLQHRQAFQGRLRFDRAGRYSLTAAVMSGSSFTGSWNNTGAGTGRPTTNLHLEQLYLVARPAPGLEVQYCGLPLVRGESTEITSYDNDGYLVGERLTLKRPKKAFFDEISVTYAWLGDFSDANLNRRFHRLKRSNYHQFLVAKSLGRRASLTVDYTFHEGAETLRQALRFQAQETRILDTIRFENYQRLDVKPAYGFALSGEKALEKHVSAIVGVARVDRDYGLVNGDRYLFGKRVFAGLNYRFSGEWIVALFATRAWGSEAVAPNRIRFEILVTYDLARGLARTGLLR